MPGHPLGLTLPQLSDPPDTQAELTILALQSIVADLEGTWTTSEALADGPLDMGGYAINNLGGVSLANVQPNPLVEGDFYRGANGEAYYVGTLGAIRLTNGAGLNLSVNGGFVGDLAHLNASYNFLNNEYTFASDFPHLSLVTGAGLKMKNDGGHFILWKPDPALAADNTLTVFAPPAAGVALWTIDTSGNVKPNASGVVVDQDTYLTGLHVAGARFITGAVTPTALVGGTTTNNYNPAGLGTANRLRIAVTGGTTAVLTGLVPPTSPDGFILVIQNISATGSANDIQFNLEDTGSTAANRFGSPINTLLPRGSVTLMYDLSLARWMCIAYNQGS